MRSSLCPCLLALGLGIPLAIPAGAEEAELPRGQLPDRMHTPMDDRPRITVGHADCDLIGSDQRALQAAVDYVAGLGGGTVSIGPGRYEMRDSLHLRRGVTVTGVAGETVLVKAPSVVSSLSVDGDYGEEQFTVDAPSGFEIGCGVTIADRNSGGFHTTVARITGRSGNTFSIDKPLNADCMVASGARAATTFPVISGYDIEGARLDNLTVDGNKGENDHLNGCRGAGIFLYRAFGTVIENCRVKNYAGDGISFQQSNDVVVNGCLSEGNTHLGFHPGSGSQRPVLRNNIARENGEDGLFLCWRVRFGTFEDNLFERNGRHGVSIGHKDTDNLIRGNRILANSGSGVYFRDESPGMAGHRNRIEANVIENNAASEGEAGIRVRGATEGVVLKSNVVRDSREGEERTQKTGVLIESEAGSVRLEENRIEAEREVDDRRRSPES